MTIRKSSRQPEELGSLSLYSQLDELGASGMTLHDARRTGAFLETVEAGLKASLASPSRLHGRRVQAMFAAVVLAMSGIRLLTVEDEGDCYFDDADGPVKVPDFRLVTVGGEQLLVEVKSVGPSDTSRPQTMSAAELDGAIRYSNWTGARLMLAHYWSGINLWTLVDGSVLTTDLGQASLTIEAALPMSELRLVGDCWIATKPPLVLSLLADRSKPRALNNIPAAKT